MPKIELGRALYVPKLAENLLSVSQLCDAGYRVVFSWDCCTISLGNKIVSRGGRYGDTYIAPLNVPEKAKPVREEDMQHVWHMRFGHADRHTIARMASRNIVLGLDMSSTRKERNCRPCIGENAQRTNALS